MYPHKRWNDRAYIHFPPLVTWIALRSNVLLLISDFSMIICVKYLWRCFQWRSGLKTPCPLPPWIQHVIMQPSIEFLNILPFVFLLALLLNYFTFYCCILLYISPCWKNLMITYANSVMHVKCFILNLLRNKDCDAWLFYILWLRW